MGPSEITLQGWARQGSVAQSQQTYEAVKNCLNQPESGYFGKSTENFLQGSYANHTNIISDSDVDIVQALTGTYYSDTDELSPEDLRAYNEGFIAATYGYEDFKRDVTLQLKRCFGDGVSAGNKAIFVPGNTYRRDADVLACAQFRRYYRYHTPSDQGYHTGIVFWTNDGTRIINFPKQHRSNCSAKNQNTMQNFKPNVRVLKNYRNAMIDEGYIADNLAPSYFLEGAMFNVPNHIFSNSHRDTIAGSLDWFATCDRDELVCANELYKLLHPSSPVTWRREKFDEFVTQAIRYWREH
ncbi:nucleotidyltransferase domain-containing protein [Erythrobacter mangrovi]|uniref:Nucleotidyltransferase n=1 Tax=Erythrobacter mangrovi TaxID=2739433 RepID=A0A7D3XSP1_9SPHN|nr:nucleotidyltransferase [Erythrobacter mangrovi]QKG71951.1 nucleotidyltransferase [Erythrobacter mangrovi]